MTSKKNSYPYKNLVILIIAVFWTLAIPKFLTYFLIGEDVPLWNPMFLIGYPLILASVVTFFDKISSNADIIFRTILLYIIFNSFFLVSGLVKTLPQNNKLNNKTFVEVYNLWEGSFFDYNFYMKIYTNVLKENNSLIKFGEPNSNKTAKLLGHYISLVKINRIKDEISLSGEVKDVILKLKRGEDIFNKFYSNLKYKDIIFIIEKDEFKISEIDCSIANNIIDNMIINNNISNNKFYEIIYVFENKKTGCIDKKILENNKESISNNQDIFWFNKLKDLNPYFNELLRNSYAK
jgi:hypothetical protein